MKCAGGGSTRFWGIGSNVVIYIHSSICNHSPPPNRLLRRLDCASSQVEVLRVPDVEKFSAEAGI